MIIVDLDDTIFRTSSMNPKIFDSALDVINEFYSNVSKVNAETIISELWKKPIDVIFNKYKTPQNVRLNFYGEISQIDFKKLQIQPFDDYSVLKNFQIDKILVTTGLAELQSAKINALGIRKDFSKIYIDDPREKPRFDKFKIFKKILNSSKLDANQVWVIGDNPESEIKAASKLGINTIQRSSVTKVKSEIADFYIETFNELHDILNNR